MDTGGFIDYRSAHDYAQGIEDAINSVEELLKEGHSAEVIELTEHALAAVEDAMGSIDDSDGYMGGILERLQEIHHAACKEAKPDPEALARRLFEWELRTDWDTFFGAADKYTDVLGEKGLALHRKLAEEEWARVPALGQGRDDPDKYGKRFRITHIIGGIGLPDRRRRGRRHGQSTTFPRDTRTSRSPRPTNRRASTIWRWNGPNGA